MRVSYDQACSLRRKWRALARGFLWAPKKSNFTDAELQQIKALEETCRQNEDTCAKMVKSLDKNQKFVTEVEPNEAYLEPDCSQFGIFEELATQALERNAQNCAYKPVIGITSTGTPAAASTTTGAGRTITTTAIQETQNTFDALKQEHQAELAHLRAAHRNALNAKELEIQQLKTRFQNTLNAKELEIQQLKAPYQQFVAQMSFVLPREGESRDADSKLPSGPSGGGCQGDRYN